MNNHNLGAYFSLLLLLLEERTERIFFFFGCVQCQARHIPTIACAFEYESHETDVALSQCVCVQEIVKRRNYLTDETKCDTYPQIKAIFSLSVVASFGLANSLTRVCQAAVCMRNFNVSGRKIYE